MSGRLFGWVAGLGVLLSIAPSPVLAQHRVILQGNDRLAILRADGFLEWEMPWRGIHDIHVLPNGNYVIGNCHAGPGNPVLIEIEPATKRVVWTLDAHDVFGNSISNSQVLDTGQVNLR